MKKLIKEDKVSDYIKKMIINNSAYSREQLGTNINELPDNMKKALHDGAPSIYEACSRNNQNLLAYFRLYFLSYFDISHGKGPLEYAIGLARIAIGELGMFKGGNGDSILSKLKVNVLFLHNSEDVQLKSRFNGNLNGLNYMELTSQLDGERRKFNRKNRDVLSNMGGNASDYVVVPISSYKEASKYDQYTSWCVTHAERHFQAYTEGGRRFYFCLKKGFKNVQKERGNGCPLDEYGLSMISVLVDSEGEPNYITTRWNHENDGENNENLRTAEQMQKITGIKFYSTFKPYTLEELRAMGITPFYSVQELLDQGVSPFNIFDSVSDFKDGWSLVWLNNKCNFIDKNNKLLSSNQWFDYANKFSKGYARVELNSKWNFIDKNNKLLFPNQWFEELTGFDYFGDTMAYVCQQDKSNLIDKEGNILSPGQWFDNIIYFDNDFIKVSLDEYYNLMDRDGNILLPNIWFKNIQKITNNYFLITIENNKKNIIDKKGNILFPDEWFDRFMGYSQNFYKIMRYQPAGKKSVENLIDNNFKQIISPLLWFNGIIYNENVNNYFYAIVYLDGKYNFLNLKNGDLLSPNLWFDDISRSYKEGVNVVIDDKKYFLSFNDITILYSYDEHKYIPISIFNKTIKENFINISKSDVKNMVMECVTKIIKEKYKIS